MEKSPNFVDFSIFLLRSDPKSDPEVRSDQIISSDLILSMIRIRSGATLVVGAAAIFENGNLDLKEKTKRI